MDKDTYCNWVKLMLGLHISAAFIICGYRGLFSLGCIAMILIVHNAEMMYKHVIFIVIALS